MNTKRTRSILSRKHPLWWAAPCSMTSLSLQWGKRKIWTPDWLWSEQNIPWKIRKCVWQKKQARETGTIESCTCCNYINLKGKGRRVKHLMKWLNSKFLNILSPLFSPRGTRRRHSRLSYTAALLCSPGCSRFRVLHQLWQSQHNSPAHSHCL